MLGVWRSHGTLLRMSRSGVSILSLSQSAQRQVSAQLAKSGRMVALPSRHKYAAVAVTVCEKCDASHEILVYSWEGVCRFCGHDKGYRFPSRLESRRWCRLRQWERSLIIEKLECQPSFSCDVNGIHICDYRADFGYVRTVDGVRVVEDTKGVETPVFRLKRRLVEACYGVKIEIVKEP